MSLLKSIKYVVALPHRAALPFLLPAGLVAAAGLSTRYQTTRRIGTAAALFFGFCLYFFRNPKRRPPQRKGAIVAPADGRVVFVQKLVPPEELGLGETPRWRVSIFLSVMDVHINRIPASGRVERIIYHPGKFLNASLDKASEHNERNAISLRIDDGKDMAVIQIAGLVARRIMCDARPNQHYETGETFGLIRFGSRTDVYLPLGIEPLVDVGQTMVGGETIIAQL